MEDETTSELIYSYAHKYVTESPNNYVWFYGAEVPKLDDGSAAPPERATLCCTMCGSLVGDLPAHNMFYHAN